MLRVASKTQCATNLNYDKLSADTKLEFETVHGKNRCSWIRKVVSQAAAQLIKPVQTECSYIYLSPHLSLRSLNLEGEVTVCDTMHISEPACKTEKSGFSCRPVVSVLWVPQQEFSVLPECPTGLLWQQLEDVWVQMDIMATGPVTPDQQLLDSEPLSKHFRKEKSLQNKIYHRVSVTCVFALLSFSK